MSDHLKNASQRGTVGVPGSGPTSAAAACSGGTGLTVWTAPDTSGKNRMFFPAHIGTGGFTLLEIMVAIFIFAVIITTVFGSFRAVFSSTDAVGSDIQLYATARSCLARMATDLSSIYIRDYPRYTKPTFNDAEDIYRVWGTSEDIQGARVGHLQFASLAHVPFNRDPRRGVCRIVYYVLKDDNDQLTLRRDDALFPFPEFEPSEDDPILCDHVLGLEFAYVDADGESTDSWDSESSDNDYATPHAVTIRLTVGQPSRPITFSTRVPLHVFRKASE